MKGKHKTCHREGTKKCLMSGWKKEWGDENKHWFSTAHGCTGRVVFLSRAVNSGPYGTYFEIKSLPGFKKPGIRKKAQPWILCWGPHNHCWRVSFTLSDYLWLSDLCQVQTAREVAEKRFFLGRKWELRVASIWWCQRSYLTEFYKHLCRVRDVSTLEGGRGRHLFFSPFLVNLEIWVWISGSLR